MVRHKGTKKLASCVLAFAALALVILIATPLPAQVSGGTFSGTVSDSSGAVIPGAQISIKDVSTGVVRTVTTDAAGFYTAPNLLPGAYDVSASATGFTTAVQSGIALTVGAQQVLNFTMQVGQVSEKVQVTGAAPAVQLATSSLSAQVNSTTVRELPLNGRDWTQLATLQPGVTSTASTQLANDPTGQRASRGFGNLMTISGTKPQDNNYRIDGITVNDFTNGSPGSVAGVTLGVDAIQEFSVLTSNYTSEYGRTSGGVINAITRSGTNQFHGDVYEFLRNSALDAANFFDNFSNNTIPPFKRNNFGGSAGGPIRKDRTFVFGDYEGFRQNLGVTTVNTVPSNDARNGIIHNANGTTTNITVDPQVKPFLTLWGPVNGTLLPPGNTGNFSVATSKPTTEDFAAARMDHKISDKDSLFGSWRYDKSVLTYPDALDDTLDYNRTSSQLIMLEETHIFSSQLVNSFRAGYSRYVGGVGSISAINPAAGDKALGAVPGETASQIFVTGLTTFTGGVGSSTYQVNAWNAFQGYDDAFLTRGKHSLKFGLAVERDDYNPFLESQAGGIFRFGSLTSFLTNKPQSLQALLPQAISPRGYRQTIFGAYIQDDIRWRPNLTVNLGLRYEMSSLPTEVQNKLAALQDVYTDKTPHLGSPLFSNPTLRNFEPRLGFAWDPFRDGKTSVRGAFGLFDVLPLLYEYGNTELATAPFNLNGSASPLAAGTFPSGAFASIATVAANTFRTTYIQKDPSRSYLMTWNLNIQRQLTPNLTATIAYVGSHGVHQEFHSGDMNFELPTSTPEGYLWPCAPPIVNGHCTTVGKGTVLNPNVGRIESTTWGNSTIYHGLQAQIVKKMAHGFQVQGSYTWSKSLDEGSGSTYNDQFINGVSTLYFFDTNMNRAVADFNVGQSLAANYTWTVPAPESFHGPAAWATSGWELGGILTLQSGLPITPLLGAGAPLGTKSTNPTDYPDRLSGPGCQSLVNPGNPNHYIKLNCYAVPMATPDIAANCVPFATVPGSCSNLLGNSGRNSLIGPGLANFDFSVFKNNPIRRISESFNVQFRAEFFNVLNHANFSLPYFNSQIFDSTGASVANAGQLNSTSTTAREIQLALKLIW